MTWADVVNIAGPSVGAPAVPTATQSAILAAVALEVTGARWGALLDTASALLAAHKATLYLNSIRGAVTEQHLGDAGQTFASSDAQTPFLDEYNRLLASLKSNEVGPQLVDVDMRSKYEVW